ncbi:hypothetical protein GCM10028793_33150 [Nocardiopsis oceani]
MCGPDVWAGAAGGRVRAPGGRGRERGTSRYATQRHSGPIRGGVTPADHIGAFGGGDRSGAIQPKGPKGAEHEKSAPGLAAQARGNAHS